MSYIIIDCSFIFDPAESWSSFGDWETDFSKFLESKGLEATKVVTSGSARQVLMIGKKQEIVTPPPAESNQRKPVVKILQTKPTLPKGE